MKFKGDLPIELVTLVQVNDPCTIDTYYKFEPFSRFNLILGLYVSVALTIRRPICLFTTYAIKKLCVISRFNCLYFLKFERGVKKMQFELLTFLYYQWNMAVLIPLNYCNIWDPILNWNKDEHLLTWVISSRMKSLGFQFQQVKFYLLFRVYFSDLDYFMNLI